MQAAALRDIVNMQERAFEAKEGFKKSFFREPTQTPYDIS